MSYQKGKASQQKKTQKKVQQKRRPAKVLNTKRVYAKVPQPLTVKIPTQESLYTTTMNVQPEWNTLAVQEMQAALTSYFLSRSIAASPDVATKLPTFYDGMLTNWIGFTSEVAGTPKLKKRLNIINDLIKAFEQKDVPKGAFGKASYSWKGILDPVSGSYPTGWNNWNFIVPLADDSSDLSPASVYNPTPSDAAYSAFLGIVKAISSTRAHQLKSVEEGAKSSLSQDVSAFSKVYVYAGLNPSKSGGFYNDIENEVIVTCPVVAHNVVYPPTQDDRVPSNLIVNEGGPATALAPLLPEFNDWFNKVAVNYKFLDFFELVNTLIYWYLSACKAAIADGINPNQLTLPMSYQDFTICVRQFVLSVYKDQWIGQFNGPLAYDAAGTNFLPFQILGNCYGNDTFKRLLGPNILAENLSMLQTQQTIYTGKSGKPSKCQYVPIWGYFDDIQPQWEIVTGQEGNIPLFQIGPDKQKVISLVDCTYSSNNYINVNGAYYSNAQEQWNTKVTALKKYINVTDLGNISPPSNAMLMQMTRVFGNIPQKQLTMGYRQLPFPSLAPISNLTLPKPPSKSNLKTPQLPAPTNVANITIQDQYSAVPVQKELHEFMEYMILPCIRLDPTSANDILNKTMYQTITREILSQIQNATSNSPAYLNRQKDTGDMCVEGAGKITSSTIAIVMRKLCSEGSGGFLSGLLGGLVKNLIPGSDGIVDTVSTMLPF